MKYFLCAFLWSVLTLASISDALAAAPITQYRCTSYPNGGYAPTQEGASIKMNAAYQGQVFATDSTWKQTWVGDNSKWNSSNPGTCVATVQYNRLTDGSSGGIGGVAAGSADSKLMCEDGSSPDITKPLAQQCPEGCPAPGSTAGTKNITTGYYNGSSETAGLVSNYFDKYANYSDGTCEIARNGGPKQCYIGSTPTSQGLYRASCDFDFQYTGAPSTPDADTKNPNTPEPPPVCTGSLGTVNGQPVCLDNNYPKTPPPAPPKPGNPRTGTSPDADSNAREPAGDGTTNATGGGTGGSAGEEGGPGVTGSGTGAPGTGSGTGSGTGTTVEVNVETCGIPGKAACKIDESGTPSNAEGKAITSSAITELNTTKQSALEGITGAGGDAGKDTAWKFSFNLPSSCSPIEAFEGVVVDPCKWKSMIHDIMAMLWIGATLFCCIGMVGRTLRGA